MIKIDPATQAIKSQSMLSPDEQALHETCQEFAAVFWEQVLQGLRRTVPEGGLFPEGPGEEAFKSLLDTEYARAIARSEGSLAEILFRQLNSQQNS